jgi:hypothetical protein
MQYFFDGTHSTPVTGTLVQDVIFAMHSSVEQAPADFGKRLRAENIEMVLAQDRLARLAWMKTHQQDVQEVIALANLSPRASAQ